ncbi:MAG: hydantoinase/oxoprolinase family protein [SAR202 cluster bacterium]|jgi:N-methylhydantoinase A|nr:methylhydantoinase [Chloroflexota bacterium]MQG57966.1 hydantoinase/oxoprolinase family protein [SAR202 cluster bacterium]MQG70633.1 hydantoinase/oxoprolinase family protein [SAR202 cluster bacterium]|tara:strand:+ start:2176 stop:4290 length:2115 start_codon:yes stop_codon:yes gene_type:complete
MRYHALAAKVAGASCADSVEVQFLARYRLGVDVGGTFTDLVLFDEDGFDTRVHKVPTTPDDQTEAIAVGVAELLAAQGATPKELLYFAQGSTIAINAMIEGKTARVGIVATQGFRDLLELGRQRRPSLYDLFFQKPLPLVARHLRLEVAERTDASGNELAALDEDAVREAVSRLAAQGVDAVAICFLFSFLNPAHELQAEKIAREIASGLSVWLSHRVLPEFREFERLGTTVANAALGPVMKRYLGNLGDRLDSIGVTRTPYIMQSSGGILSPDNALERPANTLFSGPSAGVVGGLHVARQAGTENAITFDMGGTSTDICLISGGAIAMVQEKEIAGTPIRTPMVDVNSVGAGGGSIAWVDAGGRLKVGPRSAGADPGPAAYGQGGDQPTVTDANLVLGRLSQRGLLGGRKPMHVDAAHEAIRRCVAENLGLDVMEAANGIVEIVNTNMVLATREVSVQRGYDPREFTLVAYGGAGPLHATAVARQLGIPTVVVPRTPGTLCALGLLTSDMRTDYVQAMIGPLLQADLVAVNRILNDLEGRARLWLQAERGDIDGCVIEVSADLRYTGQNYELPADAPPAPWDQASLELLAERFNVEHQRANGYRSDRAVVQLVNLRVTALAPMPRLPSPPVQREAALDVSPSERRDVWWNDSIVSTPIHERDQLSVGMTLDGPAIVEQMDSTTLIAPGERARVDENENLIISI